MEVDLHPAPDGRTVPYRNYRRERKYMQYYDLTVI